MVSREWTPQADAARLWNNNGTLRTNLAGMPKAFSPRSKSIDELITAGTSLAPA
jgi:hypothetical protein